jgi:hypothetical protein
MLHQTHTSSIKEFMRSLRCFSTVLWLSFAVLCSPATKIHVMSANMMFEIYCTTNMKCMVQTPLLFPSSIHSVNKSKFANFFQSSSPFLVFPVNGGVLLNPTPTVELGGGVTVLGKSTADGYKERCVCSYPQRKTSLNYRIS